MDLRQHESNPDSRTPEFLLQWAQDARTPGKGGQPSPRPLTLRAGAALDAARAGVLEDWKRRNTERRWR